MLPAAGMQRGSRYGAAIAGRPRGSRPALCRGNLAILPAPLASDILRFCQFNPKPCPLIGTSATGDPRVPELGEDLDIRFDLPRYGMWRNCDLVAESEDVRDLWRDDLVSFVIGCWFSFEEALMAEGIELRHIARGRNVTMYRTSIAAHAAGPFHGPMVVSMRPRRGAGQRRRAAGILGLRRDAAIVDCDGEAGVLHHGLPRQHAGERTERIPKFAIM
jgi:uncharacterized protein YcsI (UPF0317 family)